MPKNVSYWEQNIFLDQIDFAVIGSGIVGLNAALTRKAAYPNEKVVVLERGTLPSGASTKNAGFACFGSITELVEDMESIGEQAMLELVKKRWEGLRRLRAKLGDLQIDYKEHGGYELFLSEQAGYNQYTSYIPFFNNRLEKIIGVKEVFVKEGNAQQFGFNSKVCLIKNRVEGQLHPGKMMEALIQKTQQAGIPIYSGLHIDHVEEIDEKVHLKSAHLDIITNRLLIATNGFTNRLAKGIVLRPARNQVLITKPIPNLKVKGCFHYEQGYYYFRNVGNRILLGGARNLALKEETTDAFGTTATIQNALHALLKDTILPNQEYEIEHTWSGILGIGDTKQPIVEKQSDRIGLAVRLGGMGVAIGTLVGEEGGQLFE